MMSEMSLELLKGLGVTLLAATILYMWKESFLPTRGWLQDCIGQITSMLFLGYLVVCAYCLEYSNSVGGKWWRPDYLVQSILHTFITGPKLSTGEKPSMSVRYFAEFHGFVCEEHDVTTDDGFILPMQRIYKKESALNKATFKPILVQHGLMQSSGIFVTSENDSLAFYLAQEGYDVWLGNNRSVLEKHATLSTSDARFWDWSLDEMGKIDFPNQINYVLQKTGFEKLSYIGHSQGTAQAFIGLCEDPEMSTKINLFVALAPAYFIGPLGHWALEYITTCPKSDFRTFFGEKSFIGIMCVVQRMLPAGMFSSLAYHMFSYLFFWGDALWEKTRKIKYFMFTPRPASCRLIQHWCSVSRAGQLIPWESSSSVYASDKLEHETSDESTAARTYDLGNITCPIALFWGSRDKLVLGEKLTNELRAIGKTSVVHAESIEKYEHMDLIWAKDCPAKVFSKVKHLLQDY